MDNTTLEQQSILPSNRSSQSNLPSNRSSQSNLPSNNLLPENQQVIPFLELSQNIHFLNCKHCRMKDSCIKFKDIYALIYQKAKDETLIKLKAVDERMYFNYLQKEMNKEVIEEQFKKRVKELLAPYQNNCTFEKSRAIEIYNDFNTKYDLENNPTLKHLIYNFISQIILQLRLQRNISMSDIIKTQLVISRTGSYELEVVAPGLGFAIKLNDDINKTLDKIQSITEPIKLQVSGEISIKDIMHKILDLPHESKGEKNE